MIRDEAVIFLCPSCGEGRLEESRFSCGGCGKQYPAVSGIPLLFREPREVLEAWAERLANFVRESDEATKQLLKDAVEPGLLDRSRRRLLDTAEGLEARKEQVLSLFRRAGIEPSRAAHDSELESILSYVALVHRDFGWDEEDEARASLEAVLSVVGEQFRLGRTLVLGAGTGRLAWDLGNALSSSDPILLFDINPLPFLIGEALRRGETLELAEIPGHPRRSNQAVMKRTLRAANPPPPGLRYIFADALSPPLERGSFDTIVAPWFLDQVPSDLATMLPKIRDLLRPGGSFLHFGPFVYHPKRTRPAHRYTADEFVQLVLREGFSVEKATYEPMRYLGSPASTQSRVEYVLTLHAKSVEAPSAPLALESDPRWLDERELPIPRFTVSPSFELPHTAPRRVSELVNGTRCLSEIASVLVEEGHLADDGTALTATRACLKVLWKMRVREPSD